MIRSSDPRMLRGQMITVEIHRDSLSSPWGFRLRGGWDFNEPLAVLKVQPLSAAADHLKPGDVILQIRDKDAKFLAHAEALSIMKEAGSVLRLLVLRPSPTTAPQSIFETFPTTKQGLSPNEAEDEIPRNKVLASIMKQSLQAEDGVSKNQSTPRPSTIRYQQQQQQQRQTSPTVTVPSFNYSQQQRARSSSISENRMRNQIKDTMIRSSPSTSSRNSPVPSGHLSSGEGDSRVEDAFKYGITMPPMQHPRRTPTPTKTVRQLVHMQYNSPIMMYSPTNIVDAFNKNLEAIPKTIGNYADRPYLDDIRDSPTYKLIHEMENDQLDGGGDTVAAASPPIRQSGQIRALNRLLHTD